MSKQKVKLVRDPFADMWNTQTGEVWLMARPDKYVVIGNGGSRGRICIGKTTISAYRGGTW